MSKRLQSHAVLLTSTLLAACGGGSSQPGANTDQQAATITSAEDSNAMDAVITTPVTALASAAVATANLALYKPVAVSSSETGATGGAYAVDGQAGTRWSSQFSDAQWIAVDLGAATTINHVTLQWEAAYGKAYAVQVSTDNVNWRTVYSNAGGSGGTEEARFSAISARWVRMYGYQRATPWGYSLYEMKVFNDSTSTPVDALPTDAIFAPGSFWYRKIPASVPLHANSAGFTADFLRQIRAYYGNVTINTTAYASPVFQAAAGAPAVKVTQWDCQHKGYLDSSLAAQWAKVPVPSAATPSDGTDGELTIYQPSSDTLWEFWQTRKVSGQWQACWGGRMTTVSASSGIWPSGFGTTATGLPFIGGQITAEELKRGEIRHVIGIALVDLEKAGIYSWPANRSDGYNPGNAANRIPEGTRFRLDPGVNVDSLKLHPVARTIAKAAQQYGFVVWDKAGAISLRVQNPKSYTALGQPDPYAALFGGTANYAILNGFPWDKLQFMPKDYGKP